MKIKIFSNKQFGQVRTVTKNKEPFFVVKDVCDILGLTNITETIKRLDEDELSTTEVIDSIGRKQKMYITNESGLYNLIFQSRKPEAKGFRKWVTSEVLPSIRKTGEYSVSLTQLSPELQVLNQMVQVMNKQSLELSQVKSDVQTIRDTITVDYEDNWRDDVNRLIKSIGVKTGDHQSIRTKSYEMLEEKARCDLNARLRNARARALEQNWSKSKIDRINKMDCIEQDVRLKQIYIDIVKALAIKHGVN